MSEHPLDATDGQVIETTTTDGRSASLIQDGWQRRYVDGEAIDEPLYRIEWVGSSDA